MAFWVLDALVRGREGAVLEREVPACKMHHPLPSFNHHSHHGTHGSLGPFTAQHPPSVAGGASPGEDVVAGGAWKSGNAGWPID